MKNLWIAFSGYWSEGGIEFGTGTFKELEANTLMRMVLLITYESAAQVSFPKIVAYFTRSGIESALKYFGQTHLDVEKNHEIVEQQMQDTLNAIELPELTRERCMQAVDRCYDAFSRLFGHLEKTIEEAAPADTMRAPVRGQQLKSLGTDVARCRSDRNPAPVWEGI